MTAFSYSVNLVTAPDTAPTPASTLDSGIFFDHFLIDVVNSWIYWQLKLVTVPGQPAQQAAWEIGSRPMLPGSRPIHRAGACGLRFWAGVLAANLPPGGLQAVVTVEGIT